MYYQEFLPPPALQPFIHVYGFLEESEEFAKPIVTRVPPTLGVGVILYYRQDHPMILKQSEQHQVLPYGYILPLFSHSYAAWYRGNFAMIGVIFRPAQIRRFFDLPYHEIINRPTSFEELGLYELIHLQEQIQEAEGSESRIELLNQFFRQKLLGISKKRELVDAVVHNIMNNPTVHLAGISDKLGKSHRHLRRLFKEKVGISPKTFQKIVRINRVLQLIHQNGYTTLAEIAYRAGYYDHSHLDAEFKEFMGTRPTEYLTEHNHLIDALRWRDEVIDEQIIS